MRVMQALVAGLCAFLVSGMLAAQNVYYTSNADHSTEVATLASEMAAALGGSSIGFNGGIDAEWSTALGAASAILVGQSGLGTLSAGTRTSIDSWVRAGGGLHVLWTSENLDLLNEIAGTSLSRGGTRSTGSFTATLTSAATGTSFESGPADLASGSNHGYVTGGSVTAPFSTMYEDEFGDAHVLVANVESGVLAYYSWDWCCSMSTADRDEWDAVVLAGVEFAGGFTPRPPPTEEVVSIPVMPSSGLLGLILMTLILGGVALRRTRLV